MKTLNANFKLILGVIVMLMMVLTSCNPNESVDMPEVPEGASGNSQIDFGSNIQRDFMGRIVDQSSIPLDNVNITIGNKTAITDNNGMFVINDVSVKERLGFITAQKPGYLKGMRSVVPTTGTNMINIMLVAETLVSTVASGISSEVTLSNGAKVSFDGAFKDENGNAYSGNVDVYMYHLETSNPAIEAIMPGNLQAENANGEERVLVSYGMLNVELKGASGEKLNIADGSVAQIELPINPAQNGVAPATIPLWHFDEVSGVWMEDGEATLVGGKYQGEVSHFSWWNWDAPFPAVILCINAVDANNNPLANLDIKLIESNAVNGRTAFTNGDGNICGFVPINEAFTLKAFDPCGVEVFSSNIGSFSADTNYSLVLPSVTATVISGTLVNCANTNVTNGYASIIYGNQLASVPVTNGDFTLSVIQCAALTSFSLEGVDYDTFQETDTISYDFGSADVGNIIACNAVSEYITLQVDNDPVDYFLSNITADSWSSTSVSIGGQNDIGESILISGSATTLGTHPDNGSSYIGIELNSLNIDHGVPNTLASTITNFGTVGQYIDITITGSYTDNNGVVKSLSAAIHVLRDN
ncbi:carboxypeptidase-like regulatory domain-containing protein [Olleya namhaensis]|uniref:carboxypeptidase-like regulatory domain-containing protein n=1 Tax=Olleya namhaensis TaxID=1144750 RepID=UPI00248F9884|nr:carboxypeptidase-like regulatory domain-containing protein [Olleya namhaensis]